MPKGYCAVFETSDTPRIFAVPPGVDFAAAVARDLRTRFDAMPPESVARVKLLTNTARLSRRIRQEFQNGPAMLLPRISELTAPQALSNEFPEVRSGLSRELDLLRLIKPFVEKGLAPSSSAPALARSLAALLDEMGGEGVPLNAFEDLNTGDVSGHWAQSVAFLRILSDYAAIVGDTAVGPEAARRAVVERLISSYDIEPPSEPTLVIGSTASRDTTATLMEAVARLPQGAVYLPGLDFELPDDDWRSLTKGRGEVDHPQYRLAAFLSRMNVDRDSVVRLSDSTSSHNHLISLSLRPAPVTHRWLEEGPALGDLMHSTSGITLIEAANQRMEATAIACAIRRSVEIGHSVSLITPDRTLARRVSSALLRWGIVADDSAGRPLSLTAPGRLLRLIGFTIGRLPTPVRLLEILSHPLCNTGSGSRGEHLRLTHELEIWLRNNPLSEVSANDLDRFGAKRPEAEDWLLWLKAALQLVGKRPDGDFRHFAEAHVDIAETFAKGPEASVPHGLWDEAAGREARQAMTALIAEGEGADHLLFSDYIGVFEAYLAQFSVRADVAARPDVMIWGTLEARVQGADCVILSGLNEGVWPEPAAPDPWLNRNLRAQIGLPLGDREIGLAAHDYQQAVSAHRVIISRSLREADAESVPSRWLSRLYSLLGGLPDQNGPQALAEMKERGAIFLRDASALDAPRTEVAKAKRPAPAPPKPARPKTVSVTDIQRLIRDPYAFYAKRVLGLHLLKPLGAKPDAALRGIVLHRILERSLRPSFAGTDAEDIFNEIMQVARSYVETDVTWPAFGIQIVGHLSSVLGRIASAEQSRGAESDIFQVEAKGAYVDPPTGITLKGTLDRVDQMDGGAYALYDYKTGLPPTRDAIAYFDRQLPIEAMMIEEGAFPTIPAARVAVAMHLAIGRSGKDGLLDLSPGSTPDLSPAAVKAELSALLSAYGCEAQPYVARRAVKAERFEGDYDHLSRHGEWDESDTAERETLS